MFSSKIQPLKFHLQAALTSKTGEKEKQYREAHTKEGNEETGEVTQRDR